MDRLEFRRCAVGPEWEPWSLLLPQSWCPAPQFYQSAGWAFTRCPNGHYGTLSQIHTVDGEGLVNPSYVCPGCSFHEWIALDIRLMQEPPKVVGTFNTEDVQSIWRPRAESM